MKTRNMIFLVFIGYFGLQWNWNFPFHFKGQPGPKSLEMESLRVQGNWNELKRKALKHKKDPWSTLYVAEAKLNLEFERHVQFIQWDQILKDFIFEPPKGIPWKVKEIIDLIENWCGTSMGSSMENLWVKLKSFLF